MQKTRFALIGCGAVSENFYLPVLAARKDCVITHLVDKDIQRAAVLEKKHRLNSVVLSDYHELRGDIDYAIIALPHFLHLDAIEHLYKNNVSVVCEKPITISFKEAERVKELALSNRNWKFHAAFVRDFFPQNQFICEAVKTGSYGKLLSADIEEGFRYDWPAQSDFFFTKKGSGGGVLIDTGSHVFSTLLSLVKGYDMRSLQYRDDENGGVEAECELQMSLNGIGMHVKLSRLGPLKNRLSIEFEKAKMVLQLNKAQGIIAEHGAAEKEIPFVPKLLTRCFDEMLTHFLTLEPISEQYTNELTRSIEVMRIISNCYKNREKLSKPYLGLL